MPLPQQCEVILGKHECEEGKSRRFYVGVIIHAEPGETIYFQCARTDSTYFIKIKPVPVSRVSERSNFIRTIVVLLRRSTVPQTTTCNPLEDVDNLQVLFIVTVTFHYQCCFFIEKYTKHLSPPKKHLLVAVRRLIMWFTGSEAASSQHTGRLDRPQ